MRKSEREREREREMKIYRDRKSLNERIRDTEKIKINANTMKEMLRN